MRARKPPSRETALVKSILRALKFKDVIAWRANSGALVLREPKKKSRFVRLAPSGCPDILIAIPPRGVLRGLECKSPTGTLRESQIRWHAQAKRAGVEVAVVRGVLQALQIVDEWISEECARELALTFERRKTA